MSKKQCKALTTDGSRCKRKIANGQEFCWQHKYLEYENKFKLPNWIRRITLIGIITTFFTLVGFFSDLVGLEIVSGIKSSYMQGEFNIAVAIFTTSDGKKSPLGKEIAQVFYHRLEAELDNYSKMQDQDVIFEYLSPEETGVVSGTNPYVRSENAEELAKKINAHIIVYGTIQSDEENIIISPEFTVATRYIENAEELLGQYRLGTSILIEDSGENLASRISANKQLSSRTSALSFISLGLYNYFMSDYEAAMKFYSQANSLTNWKDLNGKEVLYILMGNAAAKNGNLEEARRYYERSLEINPAYARGYIGLATVYLRNELNNSRIDYSKIWDTKALFERALLAEEKPPSSFIDLKAHFGLGETNLLLTQGNQSELLEDAQLHFEYVIKNYDAKDLEFLRDRISQSYAHLGLIAYIKGESMETVQEYYERAVEVSINYDQNLAAQYWEKLASLYINENLNEEAIASLKQALLIAQGQTIRERLSHKLEELTSVPKFP
jgi:tetratricopeptide (TPR) repeat protein